MGAGRGEDEEKEDAGREGKMKGWEERRRGQILMEKSEGREEGGSEMGRGERKEEGSMVKPP